MAKLVAPESGEAPAERLDDAADRNRVFSLLLIILALTPVVFYPGFFAVFSLAKLSVLFVAGAALLILAALGKFDGRAFGAWGVYEWLPAIFISLVAISALSGVTPGNSLIGGYGRFEGFLAYLVYAVLYFSASGTDWSNAQFRWFLRTLAGTASAVSLYALVQAAGLDPLGWVRPEFEVGRAFSTFGNPIIMASFLALTIPISLYLAVDAEEWERRLGRVSLALTSAAMVVSLTRAGWIAAIVGVIAYFWISGSARKALVAGLAALVLIALAVAGSVALWPQSEVAQAITARRGSVTERAHILEISFRAASKRPIFGVGPGNFRAAFSPLDTRERSSLVGGAKLLDNAHNYPLHLAVTLGWPATLAFLVWVGLIIGGALSVNPVKRKADPVAALSAGAVAFLVSMLFTVSAVGTGAVFWIYLGLIRSRLKGRSAGVPRGTPAWIAVPGRITAGAIALVLLIGISMMAMADSRYQAAKVANQLGNNEEALALFSEAAQINPLTDRYLIDYGLLYTNKALATGDDADYVNSIRVFQRAVAVSPRSTDAHMLLGQAYLFAGQNVDADLFHEAEVHLREALRLWPHGASNHYLLGQLLATLGREDEASRSLQKALVLRPEFTQARAVLEEIEGRTAGD